MCFEWVLAYFCHLHIDETFTFDAGIIYMDTTTVLICAAIIAGCLGIVFIYNYFENKNVKLPAEAKPDSTASLPMKLQAYERLILLADRIALPNLVSRNNQPVLSAREMQSVLTQTIKQEYDHNITQQIYVSAEAWEAIRNLKEQNILIINQVSSFLPQNATGVELNKGLMNLLLENPKASLHNIVSEALSFEAKKLL
ncbi:MAG: hypothetical protein WKF89_06845 [Chitinophagaceae bacterium]